MGTKSFNILDKLISWMRLGKVLPYVEKNDTILDFGCGHQAYLLNHIKEKIKNGVGIDYDSKSYRLSPNIEVRSFHFIDKLPFLDKSFDKIFALAVIEHIDTPKVSKLFREFSRILKPGGKVILTTPTLIGKVILEFLAFRLGIISKEEVSDHKKYYQKKDLEILAKNYGFTVEKYITFQLGGNSLCVLKKS
ncbi:MAG: class I SAM-dependent methyltransferase [Patescibacteria group bacterium]